MAIRVGFFADDISRVGMGTAIVARHLIDAYLKHFKNEVHPVLIHRERACTDEICEKAEKVSVKLFHLPKFSGFFSYLWFFGATRENFDVIHFPRPSLHPFFWLLKVRGKTRRVVVTFHGAPDDATIQIYQTFASRFNRWFIRVCAQYFIDAVIVDSFGARAQVATYYGIPETKIHAVYLGVDENFHPFSSVKEKTDTVKQIKNHYDIQPPFIFTVARMDPHKNLERLIEAFFYLKKNISLKHKLVMVGGWHEPECSKKIMALINNSEFKDDVKILEKIPDEHLAMLYREADVFIFPSLSEGFGLPIVEAMASGTPVITSSISVLPEVAGDAAQLVNPYEVSEIAEVMKEVLESTKIKGALAKKGLKRAKDFTWEHTGRETIRLYGRVLER